MKFNLTTILLVGIAILLTLQLKSLFGKTHKPEGMIRNEERLKYLEQQRVQDSVMGAQRIATIDSLIILSLQKSTQLSNQYQTVKKRYDKIPAIVNDFDREQLRRTFSSY